MAFITRQPVRRAPSRQYAGPSSPCSWTMVSPPSSACPATSSRVAFPFELTQPATAAGYCHCTRCQKRTGSASSAQARIDGRTFRLLQGEEQLKAWRHPDGGFEKLFCVECGSHLFSRNPDDPTQM